MAARVFVVVIAVLGVFQVALAAGAPWGRFVWGGQHAGVLPTRFRVGSALSPLLYAAFALVVLDRAGELDVVGDGAARVLTWAVFAFMAFGVVLNGISRSRHERFTMTPVVLVLAVTSLLVAVC